jgi:lipid-A-disaccharide synthase-like uncharacterized protein
MKIQRKKDFILFIFAILSLIGGIVCFIFLQDSLQIILGSLLIFTSLLSFCFIRCNKNNKVTYVQV